ncbi:hypothetical protein Cthiooxydans_30620 [Comamonas thiooxydans]|nr:hypothetical protein Cthiooxydans_30620 [Comamonas thiooxydans]
MPHRSDIGQDGSEGVFTRSMWPILEGLLAVFGGHGMCRRQQFCGSYEVLPSIRIAAAIPVKEAEFIV